LFRTLIIGSLMLSIMSCAVTPRKTPSQLKQEDKAIILGINQSYAKELIYGLPFVDAWTQYMELFFTELEGKEITDHSIWTGYSDAIELPPGNYTLNLLCTAKISLTDLQDTVDNYHIDVEPGHIYQMIASVSPHGCVVSHVDITSGQPVEVPVRAPQDKLYTEIDPSCW